MNKKVLLVGLVVIVPIIVVLAISFGRDPHKVKSPMIGQAAPGFALQAVGTDDAISLADFKGRPVVVNFWATWCVPCFAEHEVLTSTARRMGSEVQFLGVVYDDEESKIQRFLDQYGSSYPTLVDDAGKTAIAYGVYGVPETFFINPEGTIVAKYEGALSPGALQEHLAMAR